MTSSLDPFAGVFEDFPDNDRSKRTKFGRGSGQWRFTERTPSPIKEPGAVQLVEETPSKQQPDRHLRTISPQDSGTLEALIDEGNRQKQQLPIVLDEPSVGLNDVSPTLSQPINIQARIEHGDRHEDQGPVHPSHQENFTGEPSGQSSRTSSELSSAKKSEQGKPEVGSTYDQSKHDTPVQEATRISPPTSVISIGSSSSSSSLFEEGEESEEDEESEDDRQVGEDDERDHGVEASSFNVRETHAELGHPSAFGLDGPIFSKQSREPSDYSSNDSARANGNLPAEHNLQQSSQKAHGPPDQQNLHTSIPKFSESKQVSHPNEDNNTSQQAGQQQSIEPLTFSEHLRTLDTPASLSYHDNGISVLQDSTVQEMIADAEFYLKPIKSTGDHSIQPGSTEQPEASASQPDNDTGTENEQLTLQRHEESRDDPKDTPKPTQGSKIEIIDLDDEDEDEDEVEDDGKEEGKEGPDDEESTQQQRSPSEALEPFATTAELIYKSTKDEEDSRVNAEVLPSQGSTCIADGAPNQILVASKSETGALDAIGAEEDLGIGAGDANISQTFDNEAALLSVPVGMEQVDTGNEIAQKFATQIRQMPGLEEPLAPEKKPAERLLEPPSTIPDSAVQHTNEQLLTPSDTQKTSFVSQHSTLSFRSLTDDDVLPTTNISQVAPATLSALNSLASADNPAAGSSQRVEKEVFSPQEVVKEDTHEVDTAFVEHSKREASPSEKAGTKDEKSLAAVAAEPPKTDPSLPQFAAKKKSESPEPFTIKPSKQRFSPAPSMASEKPVSSPPPFSPITPMKKRSGFAERVKAMRRESQGTPKMRFSNASSAASPWFAPWRSSHVVPDSEAGTEVSDSDEEKRKAALSEPPRIMATPEKPVAESFARSPSVAVSVASSQYVPPSQPVTGGLRTHSSYFVPLAGLPSHYGTSSDTLTIAINSTSITRASGGPRDFTQSFYITDYSTCNAKHPLTTAQIFRPHQNVFPQIVPGDAVLLRNFKVQSFQGRLSLLSTETSAWAVFCDGQEPQVRGPPIEYGPEERSFARGHWKWWGSLDHDARARLQRAVPQEKPPISISKSKVKKEGINGVGVELPGSQKASTSGKRSDQWSTQALAREWSIGLGGLDGHESSDEKPVTRRKGLRRRNERGKAISESPEKEDPPPRKAKKVIKHEYRDGTEYVDDDKQDTAEGQRGGLYMHRLRDGRKYRDRG